MQITKKRLKQIIKEELNTFAATEQQLSPHAEDALRVLMELNQSEQLRVLALVRTAQSIEK